MKMIVAKIVFWIFLGPCLLCSWAVMWAANNMDDDV